MLILKSDEHFWNAFFIEKDLGHHNTSLMKNKQSAVKIKKILAIFSASLGANYLNEYLLD